MAATRKDERRKRFIDEYLIDLNGTQAAIRAGYSPRTASAEASRLMKTPSVRDGIDRAKADRARRTGITADRVLREIACIAFANAGDIINMDTGHLVPDAPRDDLAVLAEIRIKYDLKGKKIIGREIKMCDKIRALDMLCKHLGLYNTPKNMDGSENCGVIMIPECPPPAGVDNDE